MSNFFVKSRHHFALTSPAADSASGLAKGDILGFTCITDPQINAPFFKDIDGSYLVDLFRSTDADQTSKNPEEESAAGDVRAKWWRDLTKKFDTIYPFYGQQAAS